MRKLLALLLTLVILSTPFLKTATAGYTESLSIPDGLFEAQSSDLQKNILLNELISQIVFYENYLGKNKIPPSINVVLSGNDIPGYNMYRSGVRGNSIYLIQTPDDYSNLGKFNTIFTQLIYLNFPNADMESADIISTFLNLKYFKANIPKFAGLYRYIYPNEFLYENPLENRSDKPLSPAIQMLSVARLAQMENDNIDNLRQFMTKVLNEGFRSSVRSTGVDLATFVRSAKLSLPNTKLADILRDTEDKYEKIWAGKFYFRNSTDYKIRLDAEKDIENARLFIALGDDVKSKIMLDKVDVLTDRRAVQERNWWIVLACMLLLVTAGFLYAHNRMLIANAKVLPQEPVQTQKQPERPLKNTSSTRRKR